MAVIEATNLSKSYGDTVAVHDLSFTVDAGQVVAILGPNGAGKTTTINMLTTLIPIDAGAATISGVDVAGAPQTVKRLIGLAGQTAAVDEKLTARENLKLFGRFYKMPKVQLAARIEELITEFRMADYADRPAETLSGGQRRRLDVVAALIASPPAVFLDEPTTGLDPRSRSELWKAIADLARAGTAIVLTTQYLDEADHLADQLVIIDEGREVARGTPEDLKRGLERDVLEIHFADDESYQKGLQLTRDAMVTGSDPETRLIQIGVGAKASSSLAVLRRLDEASVTMGDFQLRRPTLDEVFLTLTATGGRST